MNKLRALAATAGLLAAAAAGLTIWTTPASAQGCEPVICPAIAKICPQGQIACRVSPCNCTQACVPEGKCNN